MWRFCLNLVLSSIAAEVDILATGVESDGNIHEHPKAQAPNQEPEVGVQNWE